MPTSADICMDCSVPVELAPLRPSGTGHFGEATGQRSDQANMRERAALEHHHVVEEDARSGDRSGDIGASIFGSRRQQTEKDEAPRPWQQHLGPLEIRTYRRKQRGEITSLRHTSLLLCRVFATRIPCRYLHA
jgi:hypothetical protein